MLNGRQPQRRQQINQFVDFDNKIQNFSVETVRNLLNMDNKGIAKLCAKVSLMPKKDAHGRTYFSRDDVEILRKVKALHENAQKLQQENKSVVEQSLNLKKDLDERLGEFANILQLLDSYSAKTLTDLNDGVKNLADKCTYITDKTTNSVNNMKDCSAEIANNASMFLSRVNPLLDEISALSSSVKNNIADNKNNLAEIKSQLEQTTNLSQQHIDNMLEKTAENTLKIENSFYPTQQLK